MIPAGWEGLHYARAAYQDGYEAGLVARKRISAEDAADDHGVKDADYHAWCEGFEAGLDVALAAEAS